MEKKSASVDYYLGQEYVLELELLSDENENQYLLCIPELGRQTCRAEGETFEEAMENLRFVQKTIITHCINKGIDIPLPCKEKVDDYSGRTVLRIPKELHYRLSKEAKRNSTSLNTWLVYLLAKATGNIDISELTRYFDNHFQQLENKISIMSSPTQPCLSDLGKLPEKFEVAA